MRYLKGNTTHATCVMNRPGNPGAVLGAMAGVEPARPFWGTAPPQDSVSTNSTTSACVSLLLNPVFIRGITGEVCIRICLPEYHLPPLVSSSTCGSLTGVLISRVICPASRLRSLAIQANTRLLTRNTKSQDRCCSGRKSCQCLAIRRQ